MVLHISLVVVALTRIIEGYVVGFSLSACMIIESDSLVTINSFSPYREDFFELGALSSHLLESIDPSCTELSYVYRSGNSLSHLLAKSVLLSPSPREWTRDILLNVAHAISIDLYIYSFFKY